ncbi:MAG: hypothetical protein ACRYFZ_12340 [Janthinobacterium lividum]
MKTPAPADDASSTPTRKRTKTRPAARRRTIENTYSDPALRERLKNEIRTAAKGGEPGTWSARKSQLLTLAYQKAGGGYINRHPNSKQDWPTLDPKAARRATTTRIPKATGEASDVEKQASKKPGPRAGKRPTATPAPARKASKKAE